MKKLKVCNKDPWMLAEDIPDCDLFFSQLWSRCFVTDFAKHTGRAYKKILCKYQGYHLWFYFGEQDSYEVGQNIVDRIVNEDGYAKSINDNIMTEADKLRAYSQNIPQVGLHKLSNEQLWEIYDKHRQIHNQYYVWCWIPVAADMFHNNLTKRVKKYLTEIGVKQDCLNEYFITLTQPTKKSLIYIEQQELLEIGAKIQKNERLVELFKNASLKEIRQALPANIINLLEEHRGKYYYTKCIFINGEYVLDDYLNQLKDIFSGDELPAKSNERQAREMRANLDKREKLIDQLDISKKWQEIFTNFGGFMVTKIYRRYAQLFAIYQMGNILREIARRGYLTEMQVRFALPEEVKKILLEQEVNEAELLERTKLCVYQTTAQGHGVYIKKQAQEILKPVEKKVDQNIQVLRGEVACPGMARGKVKIIIRAEDMKKMEVGDILVSIATDPDIVPAMKKAAAIITEQSGVTSHAAIVSRELGIPCVIGTKIATRILKDGDLVEVDAKNGFVKKII
ncbi:MAG: PEP-utilizing enzyme [bacterium]